MAETTEISAARFSEMRKLSSLINANKPSLTSTENYEKKDYFSSKEKALSAILPGYAVLPEVYHPVFVKPLEEYFRNSFDRVLDDIKQDPYQVPHRDYLDSIQQRNEGYLKPATHAFQAVINDLFAGWLDSQSRAGIKPPDNQTVPPLPRWGTPAYGPYTIGAIPEVVQQFRVYMSVVTMGPAISRNVTIWGALAHECGHDITLADIGFIDECAQKLYSKIFNASELQGIEVIYNGTPEPLAKRAAEVWKFWIVEIIADVLGILNFGPASAIAYAVLATALSNNNKLRSEGSARDEHPVDVLRILMAADLVREISSLNVNIRNTWSDALIRIVDEYASNKDKITLGQRTPFGFRPTVEFPFEPMRETTKIVAKTLGFDEFKTLENHYLAEINTWADNDEIIADRIADDLLSNKEPALESQPGETEVFPAHIIAGAIYALTESADVSAITDLSVSALSKSYDKNQVLAGFPIRYTSDFDIHRFYNPF
jgi:hypothetical protein